MGSNAEFARLGSGLSQKTQKIRSNSEQIRSLLGRIALQPDDSDELMQKLQTRQHETMQVAKDALAMMHRMDNIAQDGDRGKKAQVERLREEVIRVTNDFQSAQRDLAKVEKEMLREARTSQMHRPPLGTGDVLVDMGGMGGDLGLGPGSPSSGHGTEASQQAQLQEQADLQEIEERERNMEQLNNDIMRVNEMFRDLGMLVHDQGEQVESIACNIETAHVEVTEGTEHLRKAVGSKRAVRRKKVIIAIIVIVVLAVLGVVIYFLAK